MHTVYLHLSMSQLQSLHLEFFGRKLAVHSAGTRSSTSALTASPAADTPAAPAPLLFPHIEKGLKWEKLKKISFSAFVELLWCRIFRRIMRITVIVALSDKYFISAVTAWTSADITNLNHLSNLLPISLPKICLLLLFSHVVFIWFIEMLKISYSGWKMIGIKRLSYHYSFDWSLFLHFLSCFSVR